MKEVDPWKIIEKLRAQHKEEIHNQWMPLVADYRSQLESLQSRLESLEQEMQEQARIIGMGAERELALVAKVDSLEKRASQSLIHLAKCLDQVYSGEVDHDLEHLADHARADASILSGVDLDVQANKGE